MGVAIRTRKHLCDFLKYNKTVVCILAILFHVSRLRHVEVDCQIALYPCCSLKYFVGFCLDIHFKSILAPGFFFPQLRQMDDCVKNHEWLLADFEAWNATVVVLFELGEHLSQSTIYPFFNRDFFACDD